MSTRKAQARFKQKHKPDLDNKTSQVGAEHNHQPASWPACSASPRKPACSTSPLAEASLLYMRPMEASLLYGPLGGSQLALRSLGGSQLAPHRLPSGGAGRRSPWLRTDRRVSNLHGSVARRRSPLLIFVFCTLESSLLVFCTLEQSLLVFCTVNA